MGTPIKIRRQKFYKLALYTLGWVIKNKKKRRSDYKVAYINHEQIVYPVMPTVSLRRMFKFIKKITIPNLAKISAPILIIQSSADRIVNPSSAQYLHEHLGSADKRVLWVNGNNHALAIDEKRGLIYKAIYRFITGSWKRGYTRIETQKDAEIPSLLSRLTYRLRTIGRPGEQIFLGIRL